MAQDPNAQQGDEEDYDNDDQEQQQGGGGQQQQQQQGGNNNGGGQQEQKMQKSDQFETNWDKVVESFDHMNLKEDLLRGIYAYGFEKPSAIQQRGILPVIQSYVLFNVFLEEK